MDRFVNLMLKFADGPFLGIHKEAAEREDQSKLGSALWKKKSKILVDHLVN